MRWVWVLIFAAACADGTSDEDAAVDTGTKADAGNAMDAEPEDTAFEDAEPADANVSRDATLFTVELSASSTVAIDETPIVLTALPLGDTSTTVDFFEGARRIASDSEAPYTTELVFTAADNGVHSYRARAFAASGAQATSTEIEVRVELPNGLWVDPMNGLDSNPGTLEEPLMTITHAATLAQSGQTIFLLDGEYLDANEDFSATCIAIPPGVSVRGVNVGQARLINQQAGVLSCGLVFTGDGTLEGVNFESFSFAAQFRGGTTRVRNVATVDCDTAFEAAEQGRAILEAPEVIMPRNSAFAVTLALVEGDGDLTITGGTYANHMVAGGGMVFVRGNGRLTIDGATFRANPKSAVRINDNGRATLRDVIIDDSSAAGLAAENASIFIGGSNTATPLSTSLTLERTTIMNSRGHGITAVYYGSIDSQIPIALTDSAILDSAGFGIRVDGAFANVSPNLRLNITVAGSTISGSGQAGILGSIARLDVSRSRIAANTLAGIDIGNTASDSSLILRSTRIDANGGDGVVYSSGTSAGCDLGTAGAPGANTFTAVANNFSALRVTVPITCTASGNTWLPSVQGADVQGRYPAGVVNGPATGQNYSLIVGAALAF